MKVYLDNAATTPLAPEVFDAIAPILKSNFGNPSSSHFIGRTARALIETSRRSIASHLNCHTSEIIFTSGGTEADNMALLCAVKELGVKRIITSRLEHHAVGHTVENICTEFDVELEYVKHCKKGNIDLDNLEVLLTDSKKTLVSLMHANNEIATLIPLKEVSEICRKYEAFFHSDTVQTMGHYSFDLNELDIDFLTCAAHKFHGPKGIGFLYSNMKTQMIPMIHGGSQERGYRGGTENIYGIVGLATAMDLAYSDLAEHQRHVQGLKDYMIQELQKYFSDVYFHGEIAKEKSLYTVLNVCFPATEKASMLLFTLDLKGIAASGGSACSSGATKGSHVLDGIQADMNRPNVRFSFSRYTTKEEIDYAILQIVDIFEKKIV
tara:strand:- start:233 stop:1372 length:1140 start_codon:yes stop_codon:yes gene_type:complete